MEAILELKMMNIKIGVINFKRWKRNWLIQTDILFNLMLPWGRKISNLKENQTLIGVLNPYK